VGRTQNCGWYTGGIYSYHWAKVLVLWHAVCCQHSVRVVALRLVGQSLCTLLVWRTDRNWPARTRPFIVSACQSISSCRNRTSNSATRCGLDGPGIESRCMRDFRYPSRPVLGPTQFLIPWVPGLFPGDKATGAWRKPPPPHLAPRVKKE
jgi:hypothetical protein